MDIFKAAEAYVVEMTTRKGGMKALLLDEYTTAPVSMVYSHSDILQNEIYLLGNVADRGDSGETFPDVEAIVFVRPCPSSLEAVDAELRRPRFKRYDVCFSGVIDPRDLERLAAADVDRRVNEVTEFYMDYLVIDRALFSLNSVGCAARGGRQFAAGKLNDTARSVASAVLALAMRPAVRYQGSSDMCRALAERVSGLLGAARGGGGGGGGGGSLLLIVDRREDPVTPLLNQWTYQAMLHELLGVNNGQVAVSGGGGGREGRRQQFVLTASGRDPFLDGNRHTLYDSLLHNVDRLVAEFKSVRQEARKLDTIEDMKKTIMDSTRRKEISEHALKHDLLVSEIKRVVESSEMLGDDGVGILEQELVKVSDMSGAFKDVSRLLRAPRVRPQDKARLVALFALRFEGKSGCDKKTGELTAMLDEDKRVPASLKAGVSRLRGYCGSSAPGRSGGRNCFKAAGSGLFKTKAEVEAGDLLLHTPLLATTLNDLARGALSTAAFPNVGGGGGGGRPRDVVVFFVGGTTYAEARVVHHFNASGAGMRVVLGGTHVHNLASFMEEAVAAT